jgi:adiponectin receptor
MLSASIICFGFFSIFHFFLIYREELYSFLRRLDYAGINFLIPGSCFPPYFYFYCCEKCKKKFLLILYIFFWIGKLYLTLMSTFSFIVFICALIHGFHEPKYWRIRGAFFLILGISTSIPIFHLAFFGKYVTVFEAKPHWYFDILEE